MAFELNTKGKYRELTPSYQGSRYQDGRPKVNEDLLRRMKQVTIEEAWGTLGGKGHHFQFDGDWLNLHPERHCWPRCHLSLRAASAGPQRNCRGRW